MRWGPMGHPLNFSVPSEIIRRLREQVDRSQPFVREKILRRKNGVIYIPIGVSRPGPETCEMC